MASIRLADAPDLINTAGNPLHFVGLSWAGGLGEPAAQHARRRSGMRGSGRCFVVRRSLGEDRGGFAAEYFACLEDTEISLRIWQRGLTVEYVPDAVVLHHYEFARNENKFYLLERNRAILLLTTYERRSLLVLTPMLLLTEILMLGAAVAGGWGGPNLPAWPSLCHHPPSLHSRRACIQPTR